MSKSQKSRIALIGIAAAVLTAYPLPADGPEEADSKIDRGLIQQLLNEDDNSVPFFIVFASKASLSGANTLTNWSAKGSYVVSALQAAANQSQAGVKGILQAERFAFTSFWVENKIYVPKGTLELARLVAKRPEVAAIIAEVTKTTHFAPGPAPAPAPAKPLAVIPQTTNWNISQIGADQVWTAYGNTGAGIVVANIDTGVQYTHPALVGQYRGNQGNGTFNHLSSWYDPTNQCGGAPCDAIGHGTHTMGTMVGNDGAGNVTGVAPGARWIACKACTSFGCPMSSLIACAQWALAPGGDPAQRPQIINNSWGGSGGSTSYETYVQSWVAAGMFPAFSAGDSGPMCSSASSPGDNAEAFATGSTDNTGAIASFSARGQSLLTKSIKPNLVAPGVNINSAYPYNSYAMLSGTSMSSPHTAGTVALLWAVRPAYSGYISATETLLQSNTTLETTTESCGGVAAGAVPNNTYGYGRLNAKRTVDAGATPPAAAVPPTLTITSPATNGQQFNCGALVTFSARATDPQSGNLTASIVWSGAGTPTTATGGLVTKTFSCTTEVGNRTITATVTDSLKLTTNETVVVNIVNPGPPLAPSNLTATAALNNVNLAWRDNSSNATGYSVYRRKKSGSTWSAWAVRLTLTSGTASSATDVGVSAGSYQYYVTAYNKIGASAPSNIVSVTK